MQLWWLLRGTTAVEKNSSVALTPSIPSTALLRWEFYWISADPQSAGMTDPLPLEIPLLLGLAATVILSVVSNGLYGRGIGDVSCKYRLDFSPSAPAFGIWALIYGGAVATATVQLTSSSSTTPVFAKKDSITLYALAWLFAALWTPVFTRQTGLMLILAAALLCATAALSLSAAIIENGWEDPLETPLKPWLISAPISLLAGWTTVASALSIGIAYKANDNDPDVCEFYPRNMNILTSTANPGRIELAPLLIALVVGAIALRVSDPILPMPVAWAIFFTYPNYGSWAGFVVASGCSIVAFAIAYS
jgi:hypothetical protein